MRFFAVESDGCASGVWRLAKFLCASRLSSSIKALTSFEKQRSQCTRRRQSCQRVQPPLINPQQPTNVGACSWIRSVGWRLDLPRQRRICRFVIRQLGHASRLSPFHATFRYPLRTVGPRWMLHAHPTALMGFKSLRRFAPVQQATRRFRRAVARLPFTGISARPFSSSTRQTCDGDSCACFRA